MPTNRSVVRFKMLMAALPERVKQKVGLTVKGEAQGLAALMQRVAPARSGKTKASVRVEEGKGPLNYKVKAGGPLTTKRLRNDAKGGAPTYDYVLAEEFGTSKMKAHPFFWPAYRLKRKAIKAAIRKTMREEIRKASAK